MQFVKYLFCSYCPCFAGLFGEQVHRLFVTLVIILHLITVIPLSLSQSLPRGLSYLNIIIIHRHDVPGIYTVGNSCDHLSGSVYIMPLYGLQDELGLVYSILMSKLILM